MHVYMPTATPASTAASASTCIVHVRILTQLACASAHTRAATSRTGAEIGTTTGTQTDLGFGFFT